MQRETSEGRSNPNGCNKIRFQWEVLITITFAPKLQVVTCGRTIFQEIAFGQRRVRYPVLGWSSWLVWHSQGHRKSITGSSEYDGFLISLCILCMKCICAYSGTEYGRIRVHIYIYIHTYIGAHCTPIYHSAPLLQCKKDIEFIYVRGKILSFTWSCFTFSSKLSIYIYIYIYTIYIYIYVPR